MSNNELYCYYCDSHHHPIDCPKQVQPSEFSKWAIQIERKDNGFLLTNIGNSESSFRSIVLEDTDDPLKVVEILLYEVITFFDLQGSRYDKERIVITRKPGDKYES